MDEEELELEEDNSYDIYKLYYVKMLGKVISELDTYKNIDKKMGVSLSILFKALDKGFWYIDKNKHISFCSHPAIQRKFILVRDNEENDLLYIKDYGKTWSIKREDLENDNEGKNKHNR